LLFRLQAEIRSATREVRSPIGAVPNCPACSLCRELGASHCRKRIAVDLNDCGCQSPCCCPRRCRCDQLPVTARTCRLESQFQRTIILPLIG
jgi:hypothetical protein